ncbi:hypothetical protein GIB67_003553 [Kingdonia uniflora]|uniref:Uncharacterized protein n=1 Tax=Kingdonia uniflora TaxID=39325 RepID=A0A7J7KYA9_9MAGN|nr:hypothetical protein GIB67_007988 [Kingdonia uniflora]KAF6153363.1 hypothetical protein GIB67_003553 [Kingdonia uniflora]
MKIILLLFTFFLSSISLLPSSATSTPVLDIDGHKLQTLTDYYILPLVRGRGGGLALSLRNNTCPFYVAQEDLEVSRGLPVQFLATSTEEKLVQESADVNIVFSAVTICVQSTAWRLGDVDEITGRTYVQSGGVVGNPGKETVRNWFKIVKYNSYYKLVFCPGVCDICKVICGDLGVFIEDGKRWLGLSDVPLSVFFKKV